MYFFMSSKRKRKQSEGNSVDGKPGQGSTEVVYTLFGGWLDDGYAGGEPGVIEHEGFSLTLGGKNFDISLGDAVLMRGSDDGDDEEGTPEYQDDDMKDSSNGSTKKAGAKGMIARVERIWETTGSANGTGSGECPFMFQARWFLRKEDLESLRGEYAMPAWDLDFVNRLTDDDLILSNQADDNALTTIAGDIQVVYRRPDSDPDLPSMPAEMYVCRYSVSFGESSNRKNEGLLRIVPFAGKDDKWDDFVTSSGEKAVKRARHDEGQQDDLPKSVSTPPPHVNPSNRRHYYSDSDDSSNEEFQLGGAVISEGAIAERNTRVGPEHQIAVPPFVPNQKIVSRNPTPVWKPQEISRDELQHYMSNASRILVPYLKRKGLTHTEPYSPLAWDQMEELAKEMGPDKMPTLSTICTASALSENRTDMLREVDTDALLRLLHQHAYDTNEALRAIKSSPKSFVTTMTPTQKEIVNSTFRRYAGSIRMVYKSLAPGKTFQDVIDYVYRFKIPDQFRLFQETKREQAIRMLECIESRRNTNTPINANREENKNSLQLPPERKMKTGDWQKNQHFRSDWGS